MPSFLMPLITLSYWTAAPSVTSVAGKAFMAACAAFVLLSIAVRVVFGRRALDRHAQKAAARAGSALATMGVVGLALAFFSYENAGFLGDRFWYALWLLGALAWAGTIAYGALKVAPMMRTQESLKRAKDKYLPT